MFKVEGGGHGVVSNHFRQFESLCINRRKLGKSFAKGVGSQGAQVSGKCNLEPPFGFVINFALVHALAAENRRNPHI